MKKAEEKNTDGRFDPAIEISLVVKVGAVILVVFALLFYFAAR